jgi:hypothetical protein
VIVENGLTIFIATAVGVLLVVQVAVFVGLYLLARRVVTVVEQVSALQTRAEYLLDNTEPVVRLAHGLMTDLKVASGYFVQGAEHLNAIAEMAKDEAAEVKSLLGDTTAQHTLAVATDEFEKTTALVQQSILGPAREFSYVMYGLRRAIAVLLAGRKLPVDRAYQDEEMFI